MRVMINRSVAKGLVCGLARAGDVAIGGDRDAADNLAAHEGSAFSSLRLLMPVGMNLGQVCVIGSHSR